MGFLDRVLGRDDPSEDTKVIANPGGEPLVVDKRVADQGTALIEKLLTVGIDGQRPFDSAKDVAAKALAETGSPERAIKEIISDHKKFAAGGGFVTGFGGLLTALVAIPANVAEFYLLATREVAAIAHLRGYDLDKPETRSAIMLTLVGSDAGDVLRRAGINAVPGGVMARVAVDQLPPAVRMVINKAVGFRLVGRLGGKFLSRAGKLLPVVGGVLGAGLDYRMMARIGKHASTQFPQISRLER